MTDPSGPMRSEQDAARIAEVLAMVVADPNLIFPQCGCGRPRRAAGPRAGLPRGHGGRAGAAAAAGAPAVSGVQPWERPEGEP